MLPGPADGVEFAIITSADGEFSLAYELPRDFLSAPRAFAIVVGSLGDDGQLAFLHGHATGAIASTEPFFQELEGFYYLHLANTRQVLELCASQIKLCGTLFNSEGPQAALLASLASPLTG
jgi:hypothetical protein